MLKENITFQNDEIVLKGTLVKPNQAGPHPLFIAAHNSAAATRDFTVYQHLANILSTSGVAVFLFDRRGSGESNGDFKTATFLDLAADLQAAIDHLKLRSDIDANRIGLWGMSQGAWIAPLTASKSEDVAFVVAVSAVGVSPAEQMNYSAECALRAEGFSESTIGQMLELRALTDNYYRGNAQRSEVQTKLDMFRDDAWYSCAYLDDYLPGDPANTKWNQIMDFDPLPTIKRLEIPVLLLFAESDPWVPITGSAALWRSYGPQDLTIHQIKDANHFMLSIKQSGIRADQGPPVDQYTTILTEWVKKKLG